jgi:hypothetical protein
MFEKKKAQVPRIQQVLQDMLDMMDLASGSFQKCCESSCQPTTLREKKSAMIEDPHLLNN